MPICQQHPEAPTDLFGRLWRCSECGEVIAEEGVPLKQATCCECHKPILVAPYFPHPENRHATGMPANRWDADRQEEHFVGYICNDCAFARVGVGLSGSMAGPDLEFYYGSDQ